MKIHPRLIGLLYWIIIILIVSLIKENIFANKFFFVMSIIVSCIVMFIAYKYYDDD